MADVTVNRPNGLAPVGPGPERQAPRLRPYGQQRQGQAGGTGPVPNGSRQLLADLGPEGFARWLRQLVPVAVTDTTLRDAHQSLLATRLRTQDMLQAAPYFARMLPGLLSLEAWGGATFDVALRFLKEDPWERLAALHEAVPNICLQMLIRGRNTVGYTPYPDEVASAFVTEAARTGVDIFRVFDALNDVDQMLPAIRAVLETGKVAEGAVCYTGDLASPSERLYTLDYYLGKADQLVRAGVHVLCIKDMAGLLRAPAARILVGALRARFDQPVHLHTHDTAGGQLATYLAAMEAGVDAIDGALGADGRHDQPAVAGGHRGRHGQHRPGDGAFSRGHRGVRAVLGSGPAPLPAFRHQPGRAHDTASTATRCRGARYPTSASRRSPWGWATATKWWRTCTPRPTGSSATS